MVAPARAGGGSALTAAEAPAPAFLDATAVAALLVGAGVPTAAQRTCNGAEETVAAAAAIGFPVALKLVAPGLVHKSDVGGVLLDIRSPDDAQRGYAELAEIAAKLGLEAWSVLVQELAGRSDIELFIGLKRDPTFGPIVLVGAGGRLVEILDDLAIRRCPVDEAGARALLAETTAGRAVAGYRGRPLDPEGVARAISRVSQLPLLVPGLEELDVNPLSLDRDGRWRVFDARALVAGERSAGAPAAARPPRRSVDEGARQVAAIFEARSIVVVGASATDPAKPGSKVLGYLDRHGYDGAVYVVHPTAAEIAGRPCYPSIEALPAGPLDLVCLTIPAAGCADALDRCGKRGVQAAVVMSSGFGEAGADAAEQELGRIADRHGIALCGPNTIGVVGPWERLYVSFSGALETAEPRAGGIAFVTQSGALGGSLLSQAWERGLGVSRFASVGNQTGLAIADYLAYLAADPRTRVACVVLESVVDGPALLEALARMRLAGKPVIALKTGRSAVGQSAVRSHTGALAGDARVCDAILREAGALSVATLTELVDAAAILERPPLPRGPRVGIVSTSGGGCAVAADLCAAARLEVPALTDAERDALAQALPSFAATQNPVDVTAQILVDPELIARTLRIMLASERIDSVLVVLTTVTDPRAREIAAHVAECARASGKPLAVAWTVARQLAEGGLSTLEREGVPLFPSIERAVAALAASTRYVEGR